MGQPRYATSHQIATSSTGASTHSTIELVPPTSFRTSIASNQSLTHRALPGSQPQKGVTSYTLSPNRQRPLGGAFHAAIFNTTRRTKDQILFWLAPMVIGYAVMDWAIQKNEYYNSKPGRMAAEEHGAETEINMKG
ncbi:hypothetical protein EPUS_02589 [Endocarpon pusillum Z07020]|uniref:Cytochrome b-c1 complex subunit 8 n=1 Tax=Endocarpon pusillum (strain Z07020 / HMAS-L-300199) TaxID=1263415 RepID=U1GWK7_ENDPU|nr:uncharacterized protein EPUS_02589 [Endocarpon pusillum Z07020]ERF76878.1 hypothetical protein EPUS_02589 [Endocarpon pusillum Z07020]